MRGNRSVLAAWCLPCALLAACATEAADQPAEHVSLDGLDGLVQNSHHDSGHKGHKDDFRILVFTRTAGERHASIGAGARAIENLGQDNDFGVDVSADASKFTDHNLRRYRAVVFLNTTGDVLNDGQQAAFERYLRGGGGFVGVHAAVETEPDWSFYTGLLGASAAATSEIASATVKVADRVHPSSRVLPEYWTRTDQWYNFGANVRGVSHVLATVDESTYEGGTMGFDHPIAWCKDYQGGRSWYTGGGHTIQSYSDRSFLGHLLGGIKWAAGASVGDCGATVLAN